MRSVSQGLRVGPKRRGSVTGRIPNSGRLVLPTIDEAGLAQPAHHEGVVGRHEVAESIGAERERHAGDRGGVLDGDRHAGERPLVPGPTASAAARAPSASRWTKALRSR